MARPDTQKIGGLKKHANYRGPRHRDNGKSEDLKKEKNTKKHTNLGGPRQQDGKARYTENQRTKKNKQKKNIQITGDRDTRMARPDTWKIGGLKKK